ncbi:YoaK family protein [Homoserinibacter sp. YIM 151385]|uniref:YoaK family protein n=1 Tax=Homoserinibacter sp. YIM 151385 TaxID=2985506 RepID=UPI0022F09ABF|nr:YoaK family protein [Homoserinibacter sp. YIM 151385]WBU37663.1 YoaK family protein [Homoserinibacter sp. YIM 151385]
MTATVHPRLATAGLLLLTASTGVVDAVSYLALDRVFTGNMTGNVLFIGFALVGVGGIPLLNNVLALAGFAAGSIIGGRIVGRGHPASSWPRRSLGVLIGGGLVFFALAGLWALLGALEERWLLLVTVLLAAVMGAQVSAVKPIGNSDITTIVVTNTIANLARDSRLGGGTGQRWLTRLLAVLCMFAGAAVGAGAIRLWSGQAALLAGALVFAAAVVVLEIAARRGAAVPSA